MQRCGYLSRCTPSTRDAVRFVPPAECVDLQLFRFLQGSDSDLCICLRRRGILTSGLLALHPLQLIARLNSCLFRHGLRLNYRRGYVRWSAISLRSCVDVLIQPSHQCCASYRRIQCQWAAGSGAYEYLALNLDAGNVAACYHWSHVSCLAYLMGAEFHTVSKEEPNMPEIVVISSV